MTMTRRIAAALPAIAFAPPFIATHALEPLTPIAIDRTSPKVTAGGFSGLPSSYGRTDGTAGRLLPRVDPPVPAAPQRAGNSGSRGAAAVVEGPA